MKKVFAFFCLIVLIYSCKKSIQDNNLNSLGRQLVLPENIYSYNDKINEGPKTNQKVTLGRVLFYDSFLSVNNNISCGTCHKQQFGFADNVAFNKGIWGKDLSRNSLAISGEGNNLFWDGRVFSMKDLVLKPISNHDEMFQDLSRLPEKLANNPNYPKLFEDAYGSSEISLSRISESLRLFCSALKPSNAKILSEITNFSNLEVSNFTPAEKEGYNLFFGKAKCGSCHQLTSSIYSGSFFNTGLEINYKDNGLGELTNNPLHNGIFKTPNLLDVEFTAPYMHDGRFKTLEEVVDFYDHQVQPHPNLSFQLKTNATDERIEQIVDSLEGAGILITSFDQLQPFLQDFGEPVKLNLSKNEKKSLIEFLKTFSDYQLKSDPRFSNPFK
jgi:cytochrome c peroxidase